MLLLRNTEILLLNEADEPAAPGETGEICVRGTCLTLGYYNDPERTAAAFVQNPLHHRYPERIYRTGDLGRMNERGELVFVSRRDHQIKHMGHRIELGEIEVNADQASAAEAVTALRERLPGYMRPNRVIKLDQMPLTANGKRDRTALRALYESGRK